MRPMFASRKIAWQTLLLTTSLVGLSALAVCRPDARRSESAAAYAQGTGGAKVYVFNWGDETASVLDPAQKHQVVATLPLAVGPDLYYADAAVSRDGKRVYLTQFFDDCVNFGDISDRRSFLEPFPYFTPRAIYQVAQVVVNLDLFGGSGKTNSGVALKFLKKLCSANGLCNEVDTSGFKCRLP